MYLKFPDALIVFNVVFTAAKSNAKAKGSNYSGFLPAWADVAVPILTKKLAVN